MFARPLRHRLEKLAKLLVTVQRFSPEIDCRIQEDKGEDGQLVVDYDASKSDPGQMFALGKYLENRGYVFTEKRNPWLGELTYRGKSSGKPIVVLSLPINRDRLSIASEAAEKPHRFNS